MTTACYRLCGVVFAAVLASSPATALAQTAPPGHHHGDCCEEAVAPAGDLAPKITSLDERIAMLVADMKMFTGELKIQTMTELIEVLVDRQALLDIEMRRMQEHMSDPMNELRKHAPKWIEPESELEPDTLCSPFI